MNKYKNEGKFSHNNIHDTASELFKEWELGQEEEFTLLEIILKSGKIEFNIGFMISTTKKQIQAQCPELPVLQQLQR